MGFKIGDVVERKDKDNEAHKYMEPGIVIAFYPDIEEVLVMVDGQIRYVAFCDTVKLSGIPNVFDWVSNELQA